MKTAVLVALAACVAGYTVQPIGRYLLPIVKPPEAFALVGHGCTAASGPIYAEAEDEFPACSAVQRIPMADIPPCDMARLLPTDSNIEACIGRPWYE